MGASAGRKAMASSTDYPRRHAKTIANSVTVATGKIKHTGKSSFLPEFEYLKTLLPESEWKNIKVTHHIRKAESLLMLPISRS